MTDGATDKDPTGLISVSPNGAEGYLGWCIDGVTGRVFGGQSLAQALRAASHAIGDARLANSFHAYFVAPARADAPLEYDTHVIKAGRSLDIVGVSTRQDDRVVLSTTVSFHGDEPSPTRQVEPALVDDPDDLPTSDYVPPYTNPLVRAPFQLRYAPARRDPERTRAAAEEHTWIRTRERVASSAPIDHAALLTYAIDFLLSRAAHLALSDIPLVGASLDHSMWFHRPFRADDWLLISSEAVAFAGSRSLCIAHIHSRDGELVATATQEALLRPRGDAG